MALLICTNLCQCNSGVNLQHLLIYSPECHLEFERATILTLKLNLKHVMNDAQHNIECCFQMQSELFQGNVFPLKCANFSEFELSVSRIFLMQVKPSFSKQGHGAAFWPVCPLQSMAVPGQLQESLNEMLGRWLAAGCTFWCSQFLSSELEGERFMNFRKKK